MIDLRITLNNGQTFDSPSWVDRPMKELLLTIHAAFAGVRDIEIVAVR